MKKVRTVAILLILLALGIGGGIFGYRAYDAQFVAIGETKYKNEVTELDLSGGPVPTLEILQQFPQLKKLDLRGTGLSAEEYDALCAGLPQCRVLWDVPFQGSYYPEDTRELTIETLAEGDIEAMAYFPQLASINADACTDYAKIQELRDARPDLTVSYQVSLGGEQYAWDTASLTLAGADVQELMQALSRLPEVSAVRLEAPLAPAEELRALMEAYPEIAFSWELEFKGMTVDTQTEKLDLTGMDVTVEEMDAIIPYLPSLTYVDMSFCGISNEEMDALNRRHEDVKIVWTLSLGRRGVQYRTDITWFMPYQQDFWPCGNQLDDLKYCTDIIALDVGHMEITNCSFVAYMPHLKFLILAETNVKDLTPLTGLKELVYLELFMMGTMDFTPLASLTALEDLNICYTQGDPAIIAQITWLKNLWWMQIPRLAISSADRELLKEAMPDCYFEFYPASSTGRGWRELPNYYAQRDIFGMPYMYK